MDRTKQEHEPGWEDRHGLADRADRDNRVKTPDGRVKHETAPDQENRIQQEPHIKQEYRVKQDHSHCQYCIQFIEDEPVICGGYCGGTCYCSRQCQRQDWALHRNNCGRNLSHNSNHAPHESQAEPARVGDQTDDGAGQYHDGGDAVGLPPNYQHLPVRDGLEQQDPEAFRALMQVPDPNIPPQDRLAGPSALKATLKEHQRAGLTWLIREEEGNNKGSILADDMGLGKTIQAIALILARPPNDVARKTTLVVVPTSLLRQWEREIEDKIKCRFQLKTVIYHGQKKRSLTAAKLLSHDIVLTTYGTIAHEYKSVFEKRRRESAVLLASHCIFHRIILDEAHNIKNRDSLMSRGSMRLRSTYKLCMTGTPLQNRVDELYPLFAFLGIHPWDKWENFRRAKHDSSALNRIKVILARILLRRDANSLIDGQPILTLPEVIVETEEATFDEDQRAYYNALETKTNLEMNRFIREGTIMKHYFYILVLLLRLRQCCDHPHLLKDQGIPEGIKATPEEMIKLAQKLPARAVNYIESLRRFNCAKCSSETENPVIISPCGHLMCGACISDMAGMEDPRRPVEDEEASTDLGRCPVDGCRNLVDSKRLICFKFFAEIYIDEEDEDHKKEDEDEGSLKDFVVSDDHKSSDEEIKPEVESKEGPKKEPDQKLEDVKWPVTGFDSAKIPDSGDGKTKNDDSDSDEESLPDLETLFGRLKEKFALEDQQRMAKQSSTQRDLSGDTLHGNDKQASKKRKSDLDDMLVAPQKKIKQEKGTGKRRTTALTMGAVRSSALTNAAARERYMSNLRKNYEPSSKILKTLEILGMIRRDFPDEKTLVFSQFTSFLDLVEIALTDEGYNYRRYDGSMSTTEREAAIDDFRAPGVKILLISLRCGNAGLNLQAASRVIILDPFWNPSIEDQAVGRAHRIGQERPVVTYRILVKDTVEDRILALQESKRALVRNVLDPNARRSASRLTASELAGLFNLGLSLIRGR
ncbi:hypothetical protein F5Y16DRAFT_360374 [Xylariaceae sp. FL0255]|nr:hypothetical protein F5Y16DRAFT_360374 [Xylariaceae sp. FL0255]